MSVVAARLDEAREEEAGAKVEPEESFEVVVGGGTEGTTVAILTFDFSCSALVNRFPGAASMRSARATSPISLFTSDLASSFFNFAAPASSPITT